MIQGGGRFFFPATFSPLSSHDLLFCEKTPHEAFSFSAAFLALPPPPPGAKFPIVRDCHHFESPFSEAFPEDGSPPSTFADFWPAVFHEKDQYPTPSS